MHQYQLKLLLRNRMLFFWTTLFPLVLATFFQMAFSKLNSSESFEPARLAVVEVKENLSLKEVFNDLSFEDDDQLLDVQYVSLTKAKDLLIKEDVCAYLIMDDHLQLTVLENGISQSIVQSIIDIYQQTIHSFETIASYNPQALSKLIQTELNVDYFKSQNVSSLDATVIYFYTLIGMTCMNGGYWGLKVSTNIEANLSRQGTRVQIAPVSKLKMIFIGNIAAFICQYFSMIVLLLYLTKGLHVGFGQQSSYICLLMAIGSYVGITVGNVIGQIFKKSENTKTTILTCLTMFCSFMAGMMIIDMKYLIQEYAPILAYINPVSVITDALYALYYYPTYDRFLLNIFILCVMGMTLTLISIMLSRRKQYDSL